MEFLQVLNKLKRFITILVAFLLFIDEVNARNSKFQWARPKYPMPWLEGINICAKEEVMGTGKTYYNECMTYIPREICEKPTFIRYQCCSGFQKDENGKDCTIMKPIENIMETMKNLHLEEFISNVKQTNLEMTLEFKGPYTIFAPENKAMKDAPDSLLKLLFNKNTAEEIVRNHITHGRYKLRDLVSGMELQTITSDDGVLRINRYSNGIVTANCARIVLPDQVSTNGIIHTVEKVIEPINTEKTILQILKDDEKFSTLTKIINKTDHGKMLDEDKDLLTLFAPTDKAFEGVPPKLLKKILSDKELMKRLLDYHVMKKHICSAAIIGPTSVTTKDNHKIEVSCNKNDQMVINGMIVSKPDILTKNGVVHIIDDLMVPDNVKSFEDVLNDLETYEFLEFAQSAGASDILTGKAVGNYTIFVPDQKAFNRMNAQDRRLLQDSNVAKRVFQYHFIPQIIRSKDIVGEANIETLLEFGDKIRFSVQRGGFSVNGAKVLSSDHETTHGVIHIIDSILTPPIDLIIEKIAEDPELSSFHTILTLAKLDSLLKKKSQEMTIFAPTNTAIKKISPKKLDFIMANTKELKRFVKFHISKGIIYTKTMEPIWSYNYKTLTGRQISLMKNETDEVSINKKSKIINGPNAATNGLLYTIDEALLCPCLNFKNSVFKV